MFKLEKYTLNPQHQHNVIGRTYQEHSRRHKIKDANSIKSGSTLFISGLLCPHNNSGVRSTIYIIQYSIFKLSKVTNRNKRIGGA